MFRTLFLEPPSRWTRLLASGVLIALVLVGTRVGDGLIPGWSFDYSTPAWALLAGLLGALAHLLPVRWRPLLALPAALPAAQAALSARLAALNRDMPCAPRCFVGEPCPPTSADCLAALADAASDRALLYTVLVLGVGYLPLALAMAGFLTRPSRARLPVAILLLLGCGPLVPYLLVLVGSGLGGTPGPWPQGR